jgi:hypothetical protein
MDTRIYVMTHKEYDEQEDEIYKSLAVGKVLNPQLPYMGDDTGDSISEKNRSYCELTGIYWVWKNVTCDVVGICHYRRYFVRNKIVLTKEQIESTLADFDAIVARSYIMPYKNLYEQYEARHIKKDLDVCRQVLGEMHPDYLPAFDLYFNCDLFTIGNMIITRKEIFDRYCEWLFSVLFEVEKRTDISGYEPYQARLYGYLAERLLRVWLLHNSLRVKEEDMLMAGKKELDEVREVSRLTRQYVESFLKDLITLYKTGHYFDMQTIEPLDAGLDGKTPVWTCMWKDESKIQMAVRRRLERIEKDIQTDSGELINITFKNLENYVKFPAWIVDKVNRGLINPAQLADIVQMYVLYAYGGLWLGTGDGSGTVKCQAGSVLARFVLNALYLYWYQQDEMIDENLTDIIIETAYDNISTQW